MRPSTGLTARPSIHVDCGLLLAALDVRRPTKDLDLSPAALQNDPYTCYGARPVAEARGFERDGDLVETAGLGDLLRSYGHAA